MANKLRASYTLLNLWASGNWEMAVKYYFKLDKFTTPAMADGQRLHEEWNKHIAQHKTLPDCFGNKKLITPQPEMKMVVELAPWLDLVGIIDCIDAPIYEFKSGKQTSESYASSKQAGVYAVLSTYAGIYVDRAEIYRYDQYKKAFDMSVVWITDKLLEETENYILTIAGDIHSYFEQNNLYERFGKNLVK
jgi:hypothetical protein